MARFLAIDWDQSQLRILEASADRSGVRVLQARSWTETLTLNEANAVEAGRILRQRLNEAGISSAPVLFAVGRDRLIFRDIRYPDVPKEEVAAVVRFQAVKEIHFPPEDAVIDFAPMSVVWPSGEKRALAVVLHKLMRSAIETACKTAALKLEAISPRSFGIPNIRSGGRKSPGTSDTDSEVTAILLRHGPNGELCVTKNNELLFSRAFTVSPEAADLDSITPEIRRSLAAYASQFPHEPVQAFVIAAKTPDPGGTGFQPVTEPQSLALQARLRVPVRSADPLPGVEMAADQAATFGCLVGLLQSHYAHDSNSVNFLSPKQPPAPDTSKRRYALIGVAAAVLIVLLGGGAYTLAHMSRDDEISRLQTDSASYKKRIDAYGDLEKRLEAVDKWDSSEMVVLDELYDLISRFPDLPGIIVNQIHWEPLAAEPRAPANRLPAPANGKAASKNTVKPVGKLTLTAVGDSTDALERLRRSLDDDPHWKPDSWQPDTKDPKQVIMTLKVFPQEAREYQAVLGQTTHVTATERKIDTSRNQPNRRRFLRGGGQ